MAWLAENRFWLLTFIAFVAMHLFGHGGHGGHGGHCGHGGGGRHGSADATGQTLGSAAGGWLFGGLAQRGFGLLTLPLAVMVGLLLARPGGWSRRPART